VPFAGGQYQLIGGISCCCRWLSESAKCLGSGHCRSAFHWHLNFLSSKPLQNSMMFPLY